MWEMLKGKKTYIIVAVFIGSCILEKVMGIDIPGFEAGDDWVALSLGMLGLGTLRAGVAKTKEVTK